MTAAARVQAWQTWRDRRGKVRTVVEVVTNHAGQITRKRVVYRNASGAETSCRLDKFIRWRDKWGAVIVESGGA